MNNYTETEVKLYVLDLEVVKQRLEKAGAKLSVERVYERNVRYENGEKTLTPQGIVVRLRQDTRVRLTYKEAGKAEGGVVSRTEIEVEVNDFDAMEAILQKLGYTSYMIYEKYRTTYELNSTEIVLDEMPYGKFIEIEGEKDNIEAVLQQIELSGAPRLTGSYSDLFERVKSHLGVTFDDLTFDNFKGINVPERAFEET